MDTGTHDRAKRVLAQTNGGDFADLAKKNSDDAGTKDAGGVYGFAITKNNRDLAPQVVDALFKLKPGENSGIIETPQGLEIVKVREVDGNSVRASHIFFQFKSVNTYLDPLKATEKPKHFVDN